MTLSILSVPSQPLDAGEEEPDDSGDLFDDGDDSI